MGGSFLFISTSSPQERRLRQRVRPVEQQRWQISGATSAAAPAADVVQSRDPWYRRWFDAVAVRAGPRVPGKRLRAAQEHQQPAGGVPEPEQQQPGHGRRGGHEDVVPGGGGGRQQPEQQRRRAGDRRRGAHGDRDDGKGRGRDDHVHQVKQVVREWRARATRQHAQRRHPVAG